MANSNYGLYVIDVSNPAAPLGVGFYNTSGDAVAVYAAAVMLMQPKK
jgi:hypothetical protein